MTTSGIQDRYTEHNLTQRGRGFVYGGQERIEAMARLLPESTGRTLDLGCRDGTLAALLGLDGSTIGFDIDHAALLAGATRGSILPCVADLWESLPLKGESLDLVLAGELLEHLPFPDVLVAEIARVLRPGGLLVGSVPNAFRLKNRVLFLLGRPYEHDPTHLHQFSPRLLRELLETHFAEVAIRPCVGRFTRLLPHLTGNTLVWLARKQPSPSQPHEHPTGTAAAPSTGLGVTVNR